MSESSLRFDRVTKGSLYTRTPDPDVTAPYGWRYASVERFMPPGAVTPLRVRAAPIPVASLLP